MKRLSLLRKKGWRALLFPLFLLFAMIVSFQNCSGTSLQNPIGTPTSMSSSSKYASPSVISSVTNPSVSGGTTAVVTVNLATPPTSAMTFQYQTVGGTATAGTNFQQMSGTLTFPAGQTSMKLSIPTYNTTTDNLEFSVEIGQLDVSPANVASSYVSISSFTTNNQATVELLLIGVSSNGMHMTTTANNEANFTFAYANDGILAMIYPTQSATSMTKYYICEITSNSSFFSTTSSGCEGVSGAALLGALGYIDTVKNQGEIPIYRWHNSTTGDYFDSLNGSAAPFAGYGSPVLLGYGQAF